MKIQREFVLVLCMTDARNIVEVSATTYASSMQRSCKHPASALQAPCKPFASRYILPASHNMAHCWRTSFSSFLVFKHPPKCPYYNINKELSPETCAILARRGFLSSKSFQNFTRPPCSPKAALKGSTPLELIRNYHQKHVPF